MSTKHPVALFLPLVLKELKLRQAAFAKQPNGLNWTRTTHAMLAYQQLEWAIRSPSVDHDKLLFDLRQNSDWDQVICRHTLNMDCAQAIRETA